MALLTPKKGNKMNKLILSIIVAVFGLTLNIHAVDIKDTEKNWKRHCSKCHADDGSGDTRIGQKLEVLDYTDVESLKEYTDEELFEITKEGVDGTKMRGYERKLSDEEIQAIVDYMRSFSEES